MTADVAGLEHVAVVLRGINPPVARVRSLFGDDEPVRHSHLLTRYFNGHTFPCFQ